MTSLLGVRVLPVAAPGRSLAGLFLAQAMATSAITTSVALSSIVATDLTGSARYSGVPTTLNTVVAAGAAFLAGNLMARRGRRLGLLTGYGLGAVGAALGCVMALAGSFAGFLVGSSMVGAANAITQQGRYASAELVEPESRGRVVGMVLFGAVLGAGLAWAISPGVQRLAGLLNARPVELGWGTASLLMLGGGVAILLLYRGLPVSGAGASQAARPFSARALVAAAGHPAVRVGVLNLVIGQSIMTMLMTLVPVHLQHLGQPLPVVTAVLTAHVAGMFAFAWLTGLVVDRWGTVWSSAAGGLMLIGGAVLAAGNTSPAWLAAGLFLVGLGWNYCFVAGSTMLSRHLEADIRVRFQGATDLMVWLAAGTTTLGGGYVVGTSGFSAVSVLAALVVAAALLVGGAVGVRVWRAPGELSTPEPLSR